MFGRQGQRDVAGGSKARACGREEGTMRHQPAECVMKREPEALCGYGLCNVHAAFLSSETIRLLENTPLTVRDGFKPAFSFSDHSPNAQTERQCRPPQHVRPHVEYIPPNFHMADEVRDQFLYRSRQETLRRLLAGGISRHLLSVCIARTSDTERAFGGNVFCTVT